MKEDLWKVLDEIRNKCIILELDPELLYVRLRSGNYLNINEIGLITRNNTLDEKLYELFRILRGRPESVFFTLQEIFIRNSWIDLTAILQNNLQPSEYLIRSQEENIAVKSKDLSAAKKGGEEIHHLTTEEIYFKIYKSVTPTTELIQKCYTEGAAQTQLPFDQLETYNKIAQNPRGLALILNNKYFDNKIKPKLDTRDGTDVDAANMVYLLKNDLHYDVKVETNLTAEEILDALHRFVKKKEHSEFDSAVVVLLSHGKLGTVYGKDNIPVRIDDLVDPLNRCEALAGKPKIFIIQACRGRELNYGIDVPDGVEDEKVANSFLAKLNETDAQAYHSVPIGADVLLAFATIPGFVSWRNSGSGSWFIQTLFQVFHDKANSKEIMQMLTEVNRIVSTLIMPEDSRQLPEAHTRLRKNFYFFPHNISQH